MNKFIGNRSTGKTKKLLEFAKENNCIVVCKNPGAMYFKALNYGLTGIDFIYYNELKNEDKDKNYVIDDLDEFINENFKNVKGFSLTID